MTVDMLFVGAIIGFMGIVNPRWAFWTLLIFCALSAATHQYTP
jgi:hypothetical protein